MLHCQPRWLGKTMIVLSFGMTSVMNGAGYIRYVLCSVGILTKDEEQDNGFLFFMKQSSYRACRERLNEASPVL